MQALTDLEENRVSVPDGMAKWLRSQLVAQIEVHSPALAKRLKKEDASDRDGDQFDSAYSMLKDSNDAKASVQATRSPLSNGGDPGTILPSYSHDLEQRQPAEVPSLPE